MITRVLSYHSVGHYCRHAAVAVAMLALLTGCAPARHFEAALVLQDFVAARGDSRLKQTTAEPQRVAITYTVTGRLRQGDLYLPGALKLSELANCSATKQCPRAAIVAVPGAVPQGKDDPRFVTFVTTLARAGFAVLVPELAGFRQLRIRPADSREIADAFSYVVSRAELAPDGRAGMFAFSYAVGPTILAALEDDIRQQVRFIIGLGGYHNLPRAMRFFTTGWFEHAGKWQYLTPDDTGRMVLVYSSLDYLANVSDRALFEQMVTLRSKDRHADLTPLAAKLSADGWAVYELAVNDDLARFPQLLARLPQAMQQDIAQLDLAQRDLKALKARLLLVHGINDNLIPYPESLSLAAAVPEGQARVFLIRRVLGHVDLRMADLLSWRFWSEDLPDLWRLWRVIDLLLAQRGEAS